MMSKNICKTDMSKTNDKKQKRKNIIGYLVVSVILSGVTAIVIPKVLPKISGQINKKAAKFTNAKRDEDDWGPVIEKESK